MDQSSLSPEGPWWVVVGVHDPAQHLDPAIVATTMKNSVNTVWTPETHWKNPQKNAGLGSFF